jgi:hypothetical protein
MNLTFQSLEKLNITIYDNTYNVLGYISNNQSVDFGNIFYITFDTKKSITDYLVIFVSKYEIFLLIALMLCFAFSIIAIFKIAKTIGK